MTDAKERKSLKVVFCGDGGVGKTCMIKKLRSGKFEKKYLDTMGAEVTPLKLYNNLPEVQNWDTAGQEQFLGLEEGYYLGADVIVIVFDVTSRITFSNVSKRWIPRVHRTVPNAKIVICGNKCDSKDRKINNISLTSVPYFDTSAKDGTGLYELYAKIYELAGYTETPNLDTERKLFTLEQLEPEPREEIDGRMGLEELLDTVRSCFKDSVPEAVETLRNNPQKLLDLLA